ncbi:PAS domain-containing protein [Ammoniphilus resinae]|uniref:PAS domain S-box-containing protein n=1 Tax=Ammoniphilus resinae TaxID=861532 RepID=A0ABS4GM16_9BACL|nr:PAS domain-containing protein [Ammoniphilus resinae]MBP1931313.1 PAS domain S-box-containing protein [Ammoniphilus resinae]
MSNQNPVINETNLLLKNLIDSSHDGITIADENRKIIWYNKAFHRLSGLTSQQIDGYISYQLVGKGFQETSTVKEAIHYRKVVTRFIKYSSGLECLVTSSF